MSLSPESEGFRLTLMSVSFVRSSISFSVRALLARTSQLNGSVSMDKKDSGQLRKAVSYLLVRAEQVEHEVAAAAWLGHLCARRPRWRAAGRLPRKPSLRGKGV